MRSLKKYSTINSVQTKLLHKAEYSIVPGILTRAIHLKPSGQQINNRAKLVPNDGLTLLIEGVAINSRSMVSISGVELLISPDKLL